MKILNVVGARPNFMKIAPLMRAMKARRGCIDPYLVHTGQHYDQKMSQEFFEELGIPDPDVNLEVGSASHAKQTAAIMVAFERVALEFCPDLVVVVGDVNSTIACALVASKLGVRVAHVEAGLRSFDRAMPEEINRVLTDAIADLLFTTEESANANLEREGIPAERVHFVGNVMIDTLVHCLERVPSELPFAGLRGHGYAVVTLHRPSNVDDRQTLETVLKTLADVSTRLPLVMPIHPRTRLRVHQFGLGRELEFIAESGVVTEPVGYLQMLRLVKGARMVITDSGGIQEETTYLGIPCLTMRENTERPSTLTIGTNTLVGADPVRLLRAVDEVMAGAARAGAVPPLWDGRAAERIVDAIISSTGL